MPETRWTPLQELAITLDGCNILVSAAAGAGKTSVLVERLTRRLLDPVSPLDLERLLAVTFTEKAAAEMKLRIRASLLDASQKSPGDARIERQLLVLDRAQISTIHSFCLSVIRRYFYKVGLDPRFRVLDENESELLRQDALSEMMEALYDDGGDSGDAFRSLVDRYGGRGTDEGLQAVLLRLHDFARTQSSMDGWLDDAIRQAELPDGASVWETSWMKSILARAVRDLGRALSFAEQALEICGRPYGPAGYAEAVSDDIRVYREIISSLTALDAGPSTYEVAVELLGGIVHKRLGRVAKDCDPAMRDRAKELRDAAKDLFKKVSAYAFARPAGDLAREVRETAPFVRTLVSLVRDLDKRFTGKKLDRGGLDFSDLERYCLKALEADGGEVAVDVRQGFDAVLIDEYQDTNPLQERILSLVCSQDGPGNRFMVGDLKQSIYRFRLAEPRIFLEKFESFQCVEPGGGPAAVPEGCSGARIDLTHNFRSRKEVVDVVNFLFCDFMKHDVGEIDYKGDHELRLGASYPEPSGGEYRVELHLVEREDVKRDSGAGDAPSDGTESGTPAEGGSSGRGSGLPAEGGSSFGQGDAVTEGSDSLEEFEALEKEALVVADRIAALIDPADPLMLWDQRAGAYRPCSYKDIVILMRSTKNRANAVLEVLGRCDIPAYADSGAGYFQAREVEVALALLQIIDNPRQDIPLAAVLRSPVAGLTPADLAAIRAAHKKGDFYDAVKAYASSSAGHVTAGHASAEGSGADSLGTGSTVSEVERARIAGVLRGFFSSLDEWRTLARRRPLAEVLWTILRETGYEDYVGGLPGGAQRQANLRALCDRAREFDSYGRHGLFRFLRFIEKLQDKKGDLGTARALGEQEDVVRVMSVHKAKGLEFPVVFVIDLGKQFNLEDSRQDVLYHRDLGIGPVYCDLEKRVKYPTGPHQAISIRIKDENLAEEMRVLYVALTRAKEKLVMVGSARDLGKRFHKWEQSDPASALTCLDWICPAVFASEDPPVDMRVWGTADTEPVPPPRPRTGMCESLAWRDVRELKPPATLNREVFEQVRRRMEWQYPHDPMTKVFAKMSVGDLRRRLEDEEEDSRRLSDPEALESFGQAGSAGGSISANVGSGRAAPARLEPGSAAAAPSHSGSKRLSGAERGIAVHALLSRMRLSEGASLEGVAREAERLLDSGLIQAPGLDERDIRCVASFFSTEAGKALIASPGRVLREVPFTMKVPPMAFARILPESGLAAPSENRLAQVSPGDSSPEALDFMVVQGVIDVLVDEGETLAVLDYKTDDVPETALGARFNSYLPQIALYALAAEKVLKKPVRSASIAFLTHGRVFEAKWREYLAARDLASVLSSE
ncbi:MAG: UvrD-helicase domain-containing protein [Bacillota bacterium]